MRFVPLALAASLLAACSNLPMAGWMGDPITVTLEPRSGSQVSGTLQVVERARSVRVLGEVKGLKPNAEHGFHVHENGDCSAPDGMSAGGHFNPTGHSHGRPGDAGKHHAGDMPNLKADANGVARVDVNLPGLEFERYTRNGIIGRSIVVHRDPDDYQSQPAGNSGPRVACGVIRRM
jgi:superoxide dismutase, Cu-Zn family